MNLTSRVRESESQKAVYDKLKVNTPDRSGGEEVDRLTEVVFLRRKPGIMRTTALGGRSSRRTRR